LAVWANTAPARLGSCGRWGGSGLPARLAHINAGAVYTQAMTALLDKLSVAILEMLEQRHARVLDQVWFCLACAPTVDLCDSCLAAAALSVYVALLRSNRRKRG